MPTRRLAWGLLALALAGTGCGGKIKPVPVSGRVTLDGKPLAHATIRFVPLGKGEGAFGLTDQDGDFKLTTFSTWDGALPGDYKVTLSIDDVAKEPAGPVAKGSNPKIDIMKAEMKQRGRPKKASSPIPAVYGDGSRTPLRQRVPPEGKILVELNSKMR